VEDFTASKQLERSLERAVHQVVSDTGFTVEHHRLDLIGHCDDCRR
jgi:Fe2+ or Zn2+ uptake regulation protein